MKEGKPRALAFAIDQDVSGSDFLKYLVSVDHVEALTGLDFLSELENRLENELEGSNLEVIW